MYRIDETNDAATRADYQLDFSALWRRLKEGWRLILSCLLVSICLALIYLASSTPKFRAQMVLVPAPINQSAGLGAASALGGIASLAGIDLNAGSPVAPFDIFRAVLVGPDVARSMATNETLRSAFWYRWDEASSRWLPHGGVSGAFNGLMAVLGLPDTRRDPPDWRSLHEYLAKSVRITKGIETPVFTVTFDHKDPEFAVDVLTRLHSYADLHVRTRDKQRAEASISHIGQRLAVETMAEQRVVLAAMLAEQERTLMLASGTAPYAAEIVDVVSVQREPVSPKPGLVLMGAIFFGVAAGIALVLLGFGRRRRG